MYPHYYDGLTVNQNPERKPRRGRMRPFRGRVRCGQCREQDEDEDLRALPHDLYLRDVRRAEPNPDEGGPQEWAGLHQDEGQAARVAVRG